MSKSPTDPLNQRYDFIVCGSGASGGVVASRLAAIPNIKVLLLEAGGDEHVRQVSDSRIWMQNIGSERDWQFKAEASKGLNYRTPPLPMGKVLGGGSSVNGLIWARGHKNDFDNWARLTGDLGWSYQSVIEVYKRIENWQGPTNPKHRGSEGPMHISLPESPNPVANALKQAAKDYGMPVFTDLNGEAMEGPAAAGIPNIPVINGNERISVASAYIRPAEEKNNLQVVLNACVEKVLIEKKRAVGVVVNHNGRRIQVNTNHEVILSLGAINTPKILMLSGIGDSDKLKEQGISCINDLKGVGKNFQDHILVAGCCWEYVAPEAPCNNSAEFTFFAKSDPSLATPDLQPVLEECAFGSEITRAQYNLPNDASHAWTLAPGLVRPHSRGQLHLSGNRFNDPIRVEANFLSDERDVIALSKAIDLCRELGNSKALQPFVKRELMPGPLKGPEKTDFLRNAAGTYFHQTCTAKMGRDDLSVVNSRLKVYGIDGLRIADGSIMPEITTGNTMAPCVMIGERAATMISEDHGLNS